MKKRIVTLATLGIMAWWPKAQTQLDYTKADTNKNLVSAVTNERTSDKDSTRTISFEDAKKLQENKELIKIIMKNEKVQKLVNEYQEEGIEKILGELLTDREFVKDMSDLLENENTRKTLEVLSDDSSQQLTEQYWWESIVKNVKETIKKWLSKYEKFYFKNNSETEKPLKEWKYRNLYFLLLFAVWPAILAILNKESDS